MNPRHPRAAKEGEGAAAAPAYRIASAGGAMREVPQEVFYAAACDPRRSVVVEACAGAGKTWMLVSRILRALLDGAEPAQIVAITFTKKAAGEMRERLDAWLAEYAAPSMDDAARAAQLRLRGMVDIEAAAAAPLLAGLHDRVLAAARAVQVKTFHAWFIPLVTHAPLPLLERLHLPARAELIEDIEPLGPALFRRFHARVDADAGLRDDYLALVRGHRRANVQKWLEAAWNRGAEVEAADEAGTLADSVPPPAALWPECAGLADPRALLRREPLASALGTLASVLGRTKGANVQKAALALRTALDTEDVAEAFDAACAALFTKTETVRADVAKLGTEAAWPCERLATIRAMHAQQQAHVDHRRMVRLTRALNAEYTALKRDRGLADMPDLERAALAMLSDPDVSGWVQERLDQRVRHLLIDEFQDTSPLQWHALHAWLASYAGAAQAPSVFIVGDPKQSIYRFRRADPRVFDAARAFVVDGLRGDFLACDHTRRNAPAVLAAVNATFAEAREQDGWTPFREHTTALASGGAVRLLPSAPRPEKAAAPAAREAWRDSLTAPRREPDVALRGFEAAAVADAVAALLAGADGAPPLKPRDVMVLARKRAPLGPMADALAARGVPHVVGEKLQLHQSPEALDVVALLDVLTSPGHDLMLARALRSPLFGADDADLLWLAAEARQRQLPWLDALDWAAPPTPALLRAQALLRRWRAAAPWLPPHDLIDRIVAEGDLPGRLAAAVPPARRAQALHAVQSLLHAALASGGGRYASLYGLVRDVRAGRIEVLPAEPPDAVRLLTVHGAKGLEAQAVFVVDSDSRVAGDEEATLLVDWPVDHAAPRRLAFIRSEARVPPSLQELWAEEEAARSREELNALYVAMTRAAQLLVFSRTEPASRSSSTRSWWQRVEPRATPWQPAASAGPGLAGGGGGQVRVPVLPTLPAPAAAPAPAATPAATPVRRTERPDAARLGQAVHRVLEWAGQPNAAPIDVAAAAAAATAAHGLAPRDAARVEALARRVLKSPDCARFFGGPALRWAGNEVPVAADGEALRIDRLVALADDDGGTTWWVLDYKLQHEPAAVAEYQAQLARYRAAVQALQPADRVRAAFITGGGVVVEAPAHPELP